MKKMQCGEIWNISGREYWIAGVYSFYEPVSGKMVYKWALIPRHEKLRSLFVINSMEHFHCHTFRVKEKRQENESNTSTKNNT